MVCHGIPAAVELQAGDLVNVDVSVYIGGWHGDTSRTVAVGGPSAMDGRGAELMRAASESLDAAIAVCGPGVPFSALGATIEECVEAAGFTVNRDFIGHGIGTDFHCPPEILPFRNRLPGTMEEGMLFTIEPAVCEGEPGVVILDDGWTAVTRDGGRSAQYEHTVYITADGPEILTLPPSASGSMGV